MRSVYFPCLRFICFIAVTLSPSTICSNLAIAKDSTKREQVVGLWATSGFRSTVRLEPCEPEQEPIVLCGTITWLRVAIDDDEALRTGSKNRDKVVHEGSLIGTRIISGFRQSRDGAWRGGKVYNPEDGRSYSGTIRATNSRTLELKGCALKVFCRSQTWERVSDDCCSDEINDDE